MQKEGHNAVPVYSLLQFYTMIAISLSSSDGKE